MHQIDKKIKNWKNSQRKTDSKGPKWSKVKLIAGTMIIIVKEKQNHTTLADTILIHHWSTLLRAINSILRVLSANSISLYGTKHLITVAGAMPQLTWNPKRMRAWSRETDKQKDRESKMWIIGKVPEIRNRFCSKIENWTSKMNKPARQRDTN